MSRACAYCEWVGYPVGLDGIYLRCTCCRETGLLKAAGGHDNPVQAAVASGQEQTETVQTPTTGNAALPLPQTDNPGHPISVSHSSAAGESVRKRGM